MSNHLIDVLDDYSDEEIMTAVRRLMKVRRSPKKVGRPPGPIGPRPETVVLRDKIATMYSAGQKVQQIADELGFSRQGVLNHITAFYEVGSIKEIPGYRKPKMEGRKKSPERLARDERIADKKQKAKELMLLVCRLYEEGRSTADILAQTGLPFQTSIYRYLKRGGVQPRGHGKPKTTSRDEKIIAAYKTGVSVPEIAKAHGMTAGGVHGLLGRRGIERTRESNRRKKGKVL